jgi:high-affinity Fe2+/Pb2+ permease
MVLFFVYFVVSIVLRIMLLWWLTPLLFIAYLVISWILWYKAYNWEEVDVEILDEIWDKIKDKIDDNSNNKKEL